MTTPHEDPIGETNTKLGGYFTVALTGAARAMEVVSFRRQQAARQAEQGHRTAALMMQDQLRAEATTTKEQMRQTWAKGWWDTADDNAIANAYATARAYAPFDGELAGLAQHMREEIERRFGMDPDDWAGRVEAKVEAERAARAERGEAVGLVTEANVVDQLVHADGVVTPHEAGQDLPRAEAGWDDAARRETLAQRLETAGIDGDARVGRTVTDILQGTPVSAAPSTPASQRAPKARNVPGLGAERTRGR